MSTVPTRSVRNMIDAESARMHVLVDEMERRNVVPRPTHDRAINRIFLHCSATPEGRDVSVDTIRRWHVEQRGFSDIGYHWIVSRDGTVHAGRPESQAGAHAKGHNAHSIGICYIGGTDEDGEPKDTRTVQQLESVDRLIAEIRARYGHHVEVWGHNEVSAKACPSFDVADDRAARRR